jgi:hypothetical protein
MLSRRARRSGSASRRGSVLIIVMVTMLFAATALVAFMDKATNDLLVDHRAVQTRELRMEAYSALETVLAVLQDFSAADNGLHSPAEGWNDPLGFAGYTPSQDRTIDVTFEDESGKISLPHATADVLSRLFQGWQVPQSDADMMADAMMGWMKREHVYSTSISPDYEQAAIPYEPPARPLRSYSELAAIDKVRDFFYDADGRPNDYWRQFVASVSLFDFARSNINGAKPETLAAIGQFDPTQQAAMADFAARRGSFKDQEGYVRDTSQAQAVVGEGGNLRAFVTTITALRIFITVHEGKTEYRLAAVIAPPNGAKTVQQTATSQRTETSARSSQTAEQRQAAPDATRANAGATQASQNTNNQNLRYPFTLLEIRENDEIPPAPPPPPAEGTP